MNDDLETCLPLLRHLAISSDPTDPALIFDRSMSDEEMNRLLEWLRRERWISFGRDRAARSFTRPDGEYTKLAITAAGRRTLRNHPER